MKQKLKSINIFGGGDVVFKNRVKLCLRWIGNNGLMRLLFEK